MPEKRILDDDEARRVLTRAAEIDRDAASKTSVETLRAAAREAGIAEASFEAALSELNAPKAAVMPTPRSSVARRAMLVVSALLLIIGAMFVFGRAVSVARPVDRGAPAPSPAPEKHPKDQSAPTQSRP